MCGPSALARMRHTEALPAKVLSRNFANWPVSSPGLQCPLKLTFHVNILYTSHGHGTLALKHVALLISFYAPRTLEAYQYQAGVYDGFVA